MNPISWQAKSINNLYSSFSYTVSAANEISFIHRAWLGVSDYSFKQGARAGAMPDANDYEFDHIKDKSTTTPPPDKIEETFGIFHFSVYIYV